MSFWSALLGKGTATLVGTVGKTLDNLITSDEERKELENEIGKAEMAHELAMRKAGIDEQKIYVEDTAKARDRDVDIQNSDAGWLAKNVGSLLALGTTVLTFIVFYLVMLDYVCRSFGWA